MRVDMKHSRHSTIVGTRNAALRQQDHEVWKTSSPTVTQHSDRPPYRTPVHSKFRPLFINPRLGIVRLWVVLANVRLRFVRRTPEVRERCEGVISGAGWHLALGFLYCHPQRWERRRCWSCSDSFLWVHWAFVRGWEIEACGSWPEVLPQYLPRLVRSGSRTPWIQYRYP